jgi:hypothetical protein
MKLTGRRDEEAVWIPVVVHPYCFVFAIVNLISTAI